MRSWRWALAAALLVALASVAVWVYLDSERSRDRARLRLAEESALRSAGALVAEQVSARKLRIESEVNARIAEALRRAKSASPGVRVEYVLRGTTGPISVGPDAEPVRCPECGEESACLLRPGDQGEVTAEITGLEGEYGARAVVGELAAWRLPERTLLMRGTLRADLGRYLVEKGVPRPGWAAGPALAVSGDGALAGVMILGPERAVWRTKIRPAGFLLAGQGQGVVGAAVTVGW